MLFFLLLVKWWDKGKSLIKGFIIKYCFERSKRILERRDFFGWLVEYFMNYVDVSFIFCVESYYFILFVFVVLDFEVVRGV